MPVQRELTAYFLRLKKELDCPGSYRRQFLADTRRMADDFLQGKPDAASREAADFLGDPQELARSFLDTLDPEVLHQYRARKKYIKRALIGLIAAVILFLSIWVIHLWNVPKRVEVTETLVIYEGAENK